MSTVIKKAISAVIALGVSSLGSLASANEVTTNTEVGQEMMNAQALPGMEKCFGVVKVGMNDCGNASHNCSGQAKISRDTKEWVYMPTGLCHRIEGGKLSTDK